MTIPTPRSRRVVGRRLDRSNARAETEAAEVEHVLTEMAFGATLHRGLDRRRRVQWFLSIGELIDVEIARKVARHPDVAPVGDTLFPQLGNGELSQTFRYAGEE
jgi:hypothetical protein